MYEEQLTKIFLNSITIIQPRVAVGGSGKTPEDIGREMA